MFDPPVILNLHFFKRDSYISVICQAAIYAAEGRKADAVTHLATARSQNTGNGILGHTKEKGSCLCSCLLHFQSLKDGIQYGIIVENVYRIEKEQFVVWREVMKKGKQLQQKIDRVMAIIGSHHTGAYAAQAAYFFVLSLIPILLILMAMVQYTPVTMLDVQNALMQVFPTSVDALVRSLVAQAYAQSSSMISVSILVVLWSAGKGVLSVTSGLNCIYENEETRNYLYLRFRATLYTVIFILAIMLSLLLSVFGNSISVMVNEYIPLFRHVMDFIIRIRTVVTFFVLTAFWDVVYRFLPNRLNRQRTTCRRQLPGAVFTACAWQLISFLFSVYLNIFTGFSSMYGSMTTLILIMLWLYMCMYVILLGGEINALLDKYYFRK